ncbi:MAG: GNAT family N-acetyltransferase [Prevotellaceae bacterium]|jgi:ribosomal protein S18 acetylase RimI-like enzyme|nr:GNAT family N-acetyltransferase [Prevotellaceae bacterium]
MIHLQQLRYITPDTVEAFARLIPQLTATGTLPTAETLQHIVDTKDCFLFVADEDGKTVGCATLVIVRIPSGTKAWIEDVVVDGSYRDRHIGEELIAFVLRFATARNIRQIDLTSAPSRVAANRLYQKMGFRQRETNVYRWKFSQL